MLFILKLMACHKANIGI